MGGKELARREGTLVAAARGAGKDQQAEGTQAKGAGTGAQRGARGRGSLPLHVVNDEHS